MNTSQKPLVIPIFIPHSGCPHQCAFCNQEIIADHSLSLPGRQEIDQTIQHYLKFQGSRSHVEVAFFGGNFLGLEPEIILRLLDTITPYIDQKKISSIRFSTRPDTISPQTLDLIRSYPVSTVELGVQTMNDRVLDRSLRGHTRQDTVAAMMLLRQTSYQIGAQVMVGLPGDTPESVLDSTRDLAVLGPDVVRIYPLLVLKGSRVEHWYKNGEYTPLSLEESIAMTKEMVLIFQEHSIDVIRVGLQASDVMEDESMVVAGPWHPAFGHLVFSQIMIEKACAAIDRFLSETIKNSNLKQPFSKLVLNVHPRSESRLRGNRNINLEKLSHQYPDLKISIQTDTSILLDQIEITC